MEFENFRGERVRMIEIISPVTGGFALRRAVGLAAGAALYLTKPFSPLELLTANVLHRALDLTHAPR